MKKTLSIATLVLLYASSELSCSDTQRSEIVSIEVYDTIERTNIPEEKSNQSILTTLQQVAVSSYKVAAPIAYKASASILKTSSEFAQETVLPYILSKLTNHNHSSISMPSVLQNKKKSPDGENANLETDESSDFCVVPSEEERLSYFYDEETLQNNLDADANAAIYEYGQAVENFFGDNPEDIATQRQMSHIFGLAQKVKHQGNSFVLAQITAKAYREKQKEILKRSIGKHAETMHTSSEKLEFSISELERQRDAEIEKIKIKFDRQKITLTQKHTTQLKQICAEIKIIDENFLYIDQCSGNDAGHKKLCDSKNYADIESCKAFLIEAHKKKQSEQEQSEKEQSEQEPSEKEKSKVHKKLKK